MGIENSKTFAFFFMSLMVSFAVPFSHGFTNEQDVFAINSLHIAFGSPPLPGWLSTGGDPCLEGWQGVQCVGSNISSIVLNGANLGGQLGDKLEKFSSIITIDLSNNHIGGSIPNNLPTTMKTLFLSANQFSGSIPESLSEVTLLTAMSLNNNFFTGELPDAFQTLTGLTNLDLSNNNFGGQLPLSLENLSSLTTLHVQNNQLTGTLDVLQDLPLIDLDVENNLFSGPVPNKMMSIPNFKKDGNPFNTTVGSSALPLVATPISEGPTSDVTPELPADGPSDQDGSQYKEARKSQKTIRIVTFVGVGMILCTVAVLVAILLIRCWEKESNFKRTIMWPESGQYKGPKEKPKGNSFLIQQTIDMKKVPLLKEAVQKPTKEHEIGTIGMGMVARKSREEDETDMDGMGMVARKSREEDETDMDGMGAVAVTLPVEKIVVIPVPAELPKDLNPLTSLTSFTVGSLQQYTKSFGQENLIGVGNLGSVYRAEFPDGQLLAVKKLDNTSSMLQTDESFLNLVSNISKLQHANVVKLVGYCLEHRQHLLVYEYCNNGTLSDVLHFGDELNQKLSWNARIQIALGAARALEYLHEVCEPPIVHQNFKSANLLLDDELTVRASDCGFALLILSGSERQLSGNILPSLGYGAPEFIQSGTYTCKSDIYSFGVVMLELLTGRKSYDSSRPRREQHLARWAINQLHDIASLSRMVDPSINGSCPEKSLSLFADIISFCIQSEPEFRPPMSEIVRMLLCMMPSQPLIRRSNSYSSSSS